VTTSHPTMGMRKVRISAVPTGLANALSRRKTQDRSWIAKELMQLARSRSVGASGSRTTTLNYQMFVYVAGCAFVYAILGIITWAIVR